LRRIFYANNALNFSFENLSLADFSYLKINYYGIFKQSKFCFSLYTQDVERRLKALENLPLGDFFSLTNNNNNLMCSLAGC
jgi:hypothetical protein